MNQEFNQETKPNRFIFNDTFYDQLEDSFHEEKKENVGLIPNSNLVGEPDIQKQNQNEEVVSENSPFSFFSKPFLEENSSTEFENPSIVSEEIPENTSENFMISPDKDIEEPGKEAYQELKPLSVLQSFNQPEISPEESTSPSFSSLDTSQYDASEQNKLDEPLSPPFLEENNVEKKVSPEVSETKDEKAFSTLPESVPDEWEKLNVETGINRDLEKEVITKKEEEVSINSYQPEIFQEESPAKKNVYRALRNAPPPTRTWYPSKEIQPEIEQSHLENEEKMVEEEETPEIPELPIVNIDEKMKEDYLNQLKKEDSMYHQENLEVDPKICNNNLLDQLRKKEKETGKISILARYGEDFCSKEYVTNPAIGRENEIKELNLILLTPEKSAVLVGKPGIGKTSIVEGLAYQIQRNNVPDLLKGYRIISIKTTSLMGTLPSGETRLQTLIDELKELDHIILFMDEIHMLIGATNEYGLDFANMFKESLGRGSIKMIGATTSDEYERYVLRDKAFVRRFQRVDVLEPTREQTIKILMGTLPKLEKNTSAKLKYSNYIQTEIMAFIVDITTEYKRVYGIGSRYPDICLTLLAQAFSQAIFHNRKEVTIFDIRNAIENSKNIYPDVIQKELVNFDSKFRQIIEEEK